jgi:hypothetical protein
VTIQAINFNHLIYSTAVTSNPMDRGDPLPESEWTIPNTPSGIRNSELDNFITEIEFEPVNADDPVVSEFVDVLNEIFVNGGAALGVVQIINRAPLAYRSISHFSVSNVFFEHFLTSDAFTAAVPEMDVGDSINEKIERLRESERGRSTLGELNNFAIDGYLAKRMWNGGAYLDFRDIDGSERLPPADNRKPVDARQMAARFAEAVVENRFDDIDLLRSHASWCDWFNYGGAFDCTYFVVDKRYRLIWTLAITDTD